MIDVNYPSSFSFSICDLAKVRCVMCHSMTLIPLHNRSHRSPLIIAAQVFVLSLTCTGLATSQVTGTRGQYGH